MSKLWLACLVAIAVARAEEDALFGRAPSSKGHHHQHEHRLRSLQSYSDVNQTLFSRIQSDLEPWKDGISREMIERTYCTDYISTLRMQIVNGEVYFVGEMEGFMEFHRMAKLFILDVAMKYQLPDVDLVMTTYDNCPERTQPVFGDGTKCGNKGAPLFSYSRIPGREHCVLFPTFTFGPGGWPLARIPSWDSFMGLMNYSQHYLKPWHERSQSLFFRGAPTGVRDDIISKLSEHDFRDVEFDVKTTGWTGLTESRAYIPLPAHCDYQYLLNLPGNGYASRLRYLMRCGSVPIFYDNGVHEFWYHAMTTNTHLVRIQPHDLWDATAGAREIWQAVKRLQENPHEARTIAENSQEFVEHILTTENVQRYFVELLHAYSRLQTFQPEVHPDAIHIRLSAMGPDATNRIEDRDCSFCTGVKPQTKPEEEAQQEPESQAV